MVDVAVLATLAVVAFAGGAFGAALGGLQALSLAGLSIVVGEAATVVGGAGAVDAPFDPVLLGAVGIAGSVGFGPALGPHVAFAGGVAAAAYAGRSGDPDSRFPYYEAKNVTRALGTDPDVLAVGGLFGVLGLLFARGSVALSLPWDPVAASIVASALCHRIAFGYPLVGALPDGVLDLSPFDRDERHSPREPEAERHSPREDGGAQQVRYVVEPWLPHQSAWTNVGALGAAVGVFAAFLTYVTGSPFLAFGLAVASLAFRSFGVEQAPVTHHMALPAGIVVVGLAGLSDPTLVDESANVDPAAVGRAVTLPLALLAGAVAGLAGGLLGELAERVFYAHGHTHFDPPAASLVATSLLVALLDVVGLLAQSAIPTPV